MPDMPSLWQARSSEKEHNLAGASPPSGDSRMEDPTNHPAAEKFMPTCTEMIDAGAMQGKEGGLAV